MAKLLCLITAGAAAWAVNRELSTVFESWVPLSVAGAVFVVVFCVLYFPLMKPVFDILQDKAGMILQRGRHIRTGSGIEDIPLARKTPPCSICGKPHGPICPECESKMRKSSPIKLGG